MRERIVNSCELSISSETTMTYPSYGQFTVDMFAQPDGHAYGHDWLEYASNFQIPDGTLSSEQLQNVVLSSELLPTSLLASNQLPNGMLSPEQLPAMLASESHSEGIMNMLQEVKMSVDDLKRTVGETREQLDDIKKEVVGELYTLRESFTALRNE
jgi:hypothetical protein